MVKVSELARKITSVPERPSYSPTTFRGASATPCVKVISWILPPRRMRSFSQTDRALTTDTPTPCRPRSEEHTSELQSLMRISYAVFGLKKKTKNQQQHN